VQLRRHSQRSFCRDWDARTGWAHVGVVASTSQRTVRRSSLKPIVFAVQGPRAYKRTATPEGESGRCRISATPAPLKGHVRSIQKGQHERAHHAARGNARQAGPPPGSATVCRGRPWSEIRRTDRNKSPRTCTRWRSQPPKQTARPRAKATSHRKTPTTAQSPSTRASSRRWSSSRRSRCVIGRVVLAGGALTMRQDISTVHREIASALKHQKEQDYSAQIDNAADWADSVERYTPVPDPSPRPSPDRTKGTSTSLEPSGAPCSRRATTTMWMPRWPP